MCCVDKESLAGWIGDQTVWVIQKSPIMTLLVRRGSIRTDVRIRTRKQRRPLINRLQSSMWPPIVCLHRATIYTRTWPYNRKGKKGKEKKFLSFFFVCFPRRWKMPSTATCYDVNPNYIVYSPILVQAMRCTQLFNGTSLSYWWAIVRIYIYIWWATKETAVLYEFEKAKGLFFSRFSEVLKQPVMTG